MKKFKIYLLVIFMASVFTAKAQSSFNLTVDYSQTLSAMIIAGNFDWSSDSITGKNFPIFGKNKNTVEAKFFRFNRKILTRSIIKAMQREGYRPANIFELLAIPQKPFSVVALGSVLPNSQCVPGISGGGHDRVLLLTCPHLYWSPKIRFLGIRK